MNLSIALSLHLLGVVVWVGGMFFAYMALRPAAVETLEPPQRLSLWHATFMRFFPWVWLSVILILLSGLYLIAEYGGWNMVGHYVYAMFGMGVAMMLIFAHVYFAPFKRLRRAVSAQEWKAGGAALAQIRVLVGLNLSLGIIVILTAVVGRAFA